MSECVKEKERERERERGGGGGGGAPVLSSLSAPSSTRSTGGR